MARYRFVEEGWKAYRRLMLPADAGTKSVRALRRAYFSGAAVLFTTIMETLDPGDEPTQADLDRITDIDNELREFGARFDEEVLSALLKSTKGDPH